MKQFFMVLLMVCGVLVPLSIGAAVTSGSGEVAYNKGKLSVSFHSTPIRKALEQVAAKAGIQFLMDPEIKATVSIQFKDLPLETALRRLLNHQSHAVVHSPAKDGSFYVSQVKVFKKGSLTYSSFERIGADAVTVDKGKESSPSPESPSVSSGKNADKHETAKTDTQKMSGDDGMRQPISRINPHGAGGQAKIMAAIAETQAAMALIERKAAGEKRSLDNELARAEATLASGQGDPKALVDKIRTLEQQKDRSTLNTQAMMAPELQKMQQLYQDLENFKTPAEQLIEQRAKVNSQAALMRNQMTQVEEARRAEAARQARILAEQKALAARNAEGQRQAAIRRQQEMAQQGGIH
ncbi:MAG: hypothetical protein HQL93_02805 [Magnetococcales bacterium]|nr:hypothetical protein [Magnetococcales bacterium]